MRNLMYALGIIIMINTLLIGAGASPSALAAPAEWSVPMSATTSTEGSNTNLEFGVKSNATDSYDSGLDVPQPPPGPDITSDAYFSIVHLVFPQLDKDYRGEATSISWTMEVTSSAESITLNWDTGGVPTLVSLGLTGTGIDIDMKTVSSTVIAAGGDSLTITATTTPNTPPSVDSFSISPSPTYTDTTFSVDNLSISPTEAEIGESITITVLVTNTGDASGTYQAILNLDGTMVDSQQVTPPGGTSQTVTFTITRNTAGTYQVEVSGLTGIVIFHAPPPPQPIPTLTPAPVPSPAPTPAAPVPSPAATSVLPPTPVPTEQPEEEAAPAMVLQWWIIVAIVAGALAAGFGVGYFRRWRES